ncbi:MAG TPA: GntR family transcriptional regulator [Candidatus Marinimicrobia bacterium]|nr:GntR family transcriptional regulator [Candidatus Neomarinimicrobiota bacterium]
MEKFESIGNRDKKPIYVQIIRVLTKMIENGDLPVGSQLPPQWQLAEMLEVSRASLREAMGYLEEHGVVSREQGRGTFVTASHGPEFLGGIERLEPFREVAKKANRNHNVVERSVDIVLPSSDLQKHLEIDSDTELVKVEVIEAVDDIHCMYLVDYIVDDDEMSTKLTSYSGSVLTYLVEDRKPRLSHTKSKILAVRADSKVAEKLKIDEGYPVLYFEETYYDVVGNVFGVGYTYHLTDQFYFNVIRRVPLH